MGNMRHMRHKQQSDLDLSEPTDCTMRASYVRVNH